MKQVTFTARYPLELAHPMHRALIESEQLSRVELLLWGPTEAVTTLCWYDGPKAAVRELLEAVGSIERSALVAADGGTYGFLSQREYELAASVLELVSEAELIFLPPVTFLDSGRVRFQAVGEGPALSEFYAALGEVIETGIERVRPFRRGSVGRGGSTGRLTDRQREALAAAVEVGYYEVPRTGDTEAVAAELDCEPSTAGELLRKAEAAVVIDSVTS
ncbi:helix-turn-helix domain-containing protein [Halohasta litorea]|uniref:Helix-turn-helix domain-containing protein n=1 Tax=Halohasta litorea TaxID=869891 RepID=A0ABD6DBP1_9EURY|nr:helix-turn-helix domain-containing protein [Halohasta litorea]